MYTAALICGSLALASAARSDTEPCCQGDCTVKKNQKYYSIIVNTCEEACFPFEEYDAMLALNPKLVPSHTLYPCNSHGFSHYLETTTVDSTLTMDVYTSPSKENTVKCCETCTTEGEEKFYSIARQWTVAGPWNCGESCIRPEDYETYLQYEPNLLPANSSNTPCLDNGFDIYLETETHGKGDLAMELDMYTKDQ